MSPSPVNPTSPSDPFPIVGTHREGRSRPAERPPGGGALTGLVTATGTLGAEPALPAPVCCSSWGAGHQGTRLFLDRSTEGRRRDLGSQSKPVVVVAAVGEIVVVRPAKGWSGSRGFVGPLLVAGEISSEALKPFLYRGLGWFSHGPRH